MEVETSSGVMLAWLLMRLCGCKKKYDTHKLKLAANSRWRRRMRIVLYLFGGSIKPLKKRRHKTPQAMAITLGFPFPHFPRFSCISPSPPFCRSDKAIKSNLFGFVRASFLLAACLFLLFRFVPFPHFSAFLRISLPFLSVFGNAA